MPAPTFLPSAPHPLLALPHAGGDPTLAAQRAGLGTALSVRVLAPGEKVRRPSATREVGGRHFEFTHTHTGRSVTGRAAAQACLLLRADLPACGWIDVPADHAAITTHAAATLKSVTTARKKLLGFVTTPPPTADPTRHVPGSIAGFLVTSASDDVRLQRLRDDYARKAAAGRI